MVKQGSILGYINFRIKDLTVLKSMFIEATYKHVFYKYNNENMITLITIKTAQFDKYNRVDI
jgi:hypothetical protein